MPDAQALAKELIDTTDARVWARRFMESFDGQLIGEQVDEGTMLGWFANALCTGQRAGQGIVTGSS